MPKREGTVRIFSVGGSATAGVPFYNQGSFSMFLELVLNASDRRHNYEVINAGVPGGSSLEVAEIFEELVGYDPDYFVVYMGNNEFIGRDDKKERGLRGSLGYWSERLTNDLMTYKVIAGFLLRNAQPPLPAEDFDGPETIMTRVMAFRDIAVNKNWDESARAEVVSRYERNLVRMVRMARSRGVGVILCSLSVNARDYPPFQSGDEFWNADRCEAGDGENDPAARVERDSRGEPLDCRRLKSEHENGRLDTFSTYRMGCCYLGQGNLTAAREHFLLAVERDPIPIRASPSINRTIRKVAQSEDVHLADVEEAFFKYSDYGVPGEELFVESRHPTIGGHALIALTIMDALVRDGEIQPVSDWRARADNEIEKHQRTVSPDYFSMAYFTEASLSAGMGRFKLAGRLCRQALFYSPKNPMIPELMGHIDEILNNQMWKDRDQGMDHPGSGK